MNEKKFTPGPWKFDKFDGMVVTKNGSQFVADVFTNLQADCDLIAAAPEMYEALSDICEMLKKDGSFPKTVPEIEKLLKKARGEI